MRPNPDSDFPIDGIADEFRRLAEEANQLFWVVSADLSELYYISPVYEKIWGRSIAELRENPRTFLDSIHPDDREIIAAGQRQWLESGDRNVSDVEYRVLHPDGGVRWIRAIVFPLIDEEKQVVRVAGIAHDITEQQRVGNALKRSEERFRTIFENAPVMIDSFDQNGRCMLWNAECERTLGWTRAEVLKHPDPLSLFYEDPEVLERARSTVRKADGCFREYIVRAKDGSCRTQLWADFELPRGEMIGVGYDVTEQNASELALRESEEKYRVLFEHTGCSVVFFDGEGNILLLNQVAASNLGTTKAKLIDKNIAELIPDGARYARRMRQVVDTGIGMQVEDETDLPSGRYCYWSTLTPVKDASGVIVGVQVVSHDITERKIAEEEVRRSREQMRALAERLQTVQEEESTKIAREVHDELGQKLTALKMDLAWVQRRVSRANSRETRGAVIEKIALMASEIDETVGTVRKIATRLRRGILDDLGLVGAMELEAEQFARRTGVVCEVDLGDITIDVDRACSTAMFRIFQEILTNISRHAGAKNVTVHLENVGGMIEVTVVDDGCGIDLDAGEGVTGLGILGMRERAASCGGTVAIVRNGDRGTRVDVTIPARTPKAEEA